MIRNLKRKQIPVPSPNRDKKNKINNRKKTQKTVRKTQK